ncbi:MAG TPA: hypothetical protein VF054_06170 [Micromonosporaceae bacterium]
MDTLETIVGSGDDRKPRRRFVRHLVGPEQAPVAVVGFGLLVFLASQLLPWMTVTPNIDDSSTGSSYAITVNSLRNLGFADINTWQTSMYLTAWAALLGLAGAAFAARDRARRMLVAAGFGVVAFQTVDMIGVAALLHSGGPAFGVLRQVLEARSTGPGYGIGLGVWAALLAPLLVGAGMFIGVRRGVATSAPGEATPVDLADQFDGYRELDDRALEITVAPANPFEPDRG